MLHENKDLLSYWLLHFLDLEQQDIDIGDLDIDIGIGYRYRYICIHKGRPLSLAAS